MNTTPAAVARRRRVRTWRRTELARRILRSVVAGVVLGGVAVIAAAHQMGLL